MPTPVGDCKEAVVKMPFGSYRVFLTSYDHQVGPDPLAKTEHPWCNSHCHSSEDSLLQRKLLLSPRIPKPSLTLPSLGKQIAWPGRKT